MLMMMMMMMIMSIQDDVKFIRRGRHYLTLLPQLVSGEGYWKHIALVPALVSGASLSSVISLSLLHILSFPFL